MRGWKRNEAVRATVEAETGPYDAGATYANGHRNRLGDHLIAHTGCGAACKVAAIYRRAARYAAKVSK